MSIQLDKQTLKEMAIRRSVDDLSVLLEWADEQIPGPSIFLPADPASADAEPPTVVEITPTAPAPEPPAAAAVPAEAAPIKPDDVDEAAAAPAADAAPDAPQSETPAA